MKKPFCKLLSKKNNIRPFDDVNTLEFFSQKNDCSLFLVGSHSKKRPQNLIMGRLFNYQLLDMVEFGVLDYKSTDSFKSLKVGFWVTHLEIEPSWPEAYVPLPERFMAIFGEAHLSEESSSGFLPRSGSGINKSCRSQSRH